MQIDNKKIIFVVHSFKGGGVEKVASTLLEAIQNSEKTLTIVIVLFKREKIGCLGSNTIVKYLDVYENGSVIYTIRKFFKIIYRLQKIIRKESPCIVFSFMDYSNVLCVISNWISRKKNRVIVSVHTIPMLKYATNIWERILRLMIKKFYNKADSIIAVSEHIGIDLTENFKIDRNRIHIIHNPIDANKINLLSAEDVYEKVFCENIPIILSVGRLSNEKGFDYLLKAFSMLNQNFDARLVILGEGKEGINLKRLSSNLGIDRKVFFLGYKENPYKYMKRATIFVLPSLYEGFGIVIVEAMACGIPVIATQSYAGIEDIIEHEKTGLLIPVADEKALSESMFRLLNDEELRRSLSMEAKKKVENFSIDKITKRYKKVLLDI